MINIYSMDLNNNFVDSLRESTDALHETLKSAKHIASAETEPQKEIMLLLLANLRSSMEIQNSLVTALETYINSEKK